MANTVTGLAQLMRPDKNKKKKKAKRKYESVRWRESGDFLEQKSQGSAKEGPCVRVILISEGLGNRRNMNYYGPGAIESAPDVFEGKKCFLDHATDTEERDIPERRVKDACGYFINCVVEPIDGKQACTGELHFDLSESGQLAYAKALTAIHYREEFPNLDAEYVGLSVNADGDTEKKTMDVEGETLEVNYVTKFTGAMSCDVVTYPARGGKFLALVEDAAGAQLRKKEVSTMVIKTLEAARTALKEAKTDKDIAEAKKTVSDIVETLLKEARKAAKSKEAEGDEADESDEADEADEDEADAPAKKKVKQGKKGKQAAEDESEDTEDEADEDETDEDEDDNSKDNKDDGDDDDTVESSRILLIKHLIKESSVPKSYFSPSIYRMKLAEAKAEIARMKKFKESIVREAVKAMDSSGSSTLKLHESADGEGSNDSLFASCTE